MKRWISLSQLKFIFYCFFNEVLEYIWIHLLTTMISVCWGPIAPRFSCFAVDFAQMNKYVFIHYFLKTMLFSIKYLFNHYDYLKPWPGTPGQAVVLPAEGGQGQARGRRLLQLHPPDLEAAAGGDQEGGQGPCRPRRDLQHRSHGQADIESLVTKGTMTGMQIWELVMKFFICS